MLLDGRVRGEEKQRRLARSEVAKNHACLGWGRTGDMGFGEVKRGMPTVSHTWAPDGKHILFSAPDPADLPTYDLWRVPVKGGTPEKMGLQRKWGIWSLSVRPDGRELAFAGRGGASTDSEIWVMENFLPLAGNSE